MRPKDRAHVKANMPKLTALKDFSYFHHGYERRDYAEGSEIDTDDQEMIDVALAQNWASSESQPKEPDVTPAKRGRKPKSKE